MKYLWMLLLVVPTLAQAAGEWHKAWGRESWGTFEYDFDSEKPWVEIQEKLPPAPKEENLLEFFVSSATDNRFFVDSASLAPGPDGVMRYILVIRSPSGSLNVTFEGMRCKSKERKIYAIGRPDGTWGRARNPRWEVIRYEARNRQHHMLFDDFFCPVGILAETPEKVREAFEREKRRLTR